MKTALQDLIINHNIKGIFMGTRRTDPYSSNLNYIAPTDSNRGWPAFDRILPILDFSYDQIWSFLIDFEVPVCSLYEQGFTYLGDKNDSTPNPFLKFGEGYHPAWMSQEILEPFSRMSYFDKLEKDGGVQLSSDCFMKIIIMRDHQLSSDKLDEAIQTAIITFAAEHPFFNVSETESLELARSILKNTERIEISHADLESTARDQIRDQIIKNGDARKLCFFLVQDKTRESFKIM